MGGRGSAAKKAGGGSLSDTPRQMSASEASKILGELPKADIEGLKPTKAANETFNNYFYESKRLLKDSDQQDAKRTWGHFNHKDSDKILSLRSLKGVQHNINSSYKGLKLDLELGIISPKSAKFEMGALSMMQRTVNDEYRDLKKWRGDR